MQTRTVEQVESWDARPFSGGVRELHELADDDFSGTVVAEDTWVFFLNGRVVGVFQGELDVLRDASGTIYAAPDPSLPLLFSMQERGGETQAKYFTNDTPVAEVDRTLRDANFVGYLELSENVLSGDYYVSFYGGKSMSTAFIGQSERLVTGEEAFEKANDEVGVFEVRTVSLGITELPDRPEEPSSTDDTATDIDASSATGSSTATDPSTDTDASPGSESTTGNESADADASTPAAENRPTHSTEASPPVQEAEDELDRSDDQRDSQSPPQESVETESVPDEKGEDEPSDSVDQPTQREGEIESEETTATDSQNESEREEATATDSRNETEREGTTATDSPTETDRSPEDAPLSEHERAVREWAAKDRSEHDDGTTEDLFREEAAWRETNSIPALDPDESAEQNSEGTTATGGKSPTQRDRKRADDRPEPSTSNTDTMRTSGSKQLTKLKSAVEERDSRIEALESELDAAESARADLEATVADLRAERSDLEGRIEALESKLETKGAASSAGQSTATDIPPADALTGTNLFVRYYSKGEATLETLGNSSVDPEAVNDNLRLDHHTEFDEDEVTVNGRPVDEFLASSSPYRFVDWLIRELPYELIDSGATSGLQDVYDAISAFDRIEFDGTVEVETGEGEAVSHSFDVVVRDRMGEPLVVAAINDSRDPVVRESMDDLVAGATVLGEEIESLAGAFYVTASYFEPGALERAQDAASTGGFFGRSDRESYVKVSRKRGFHLCLVEDRGDAFHVTVPEL